MSKDYQRQYDEAHEVLEVAESDGFKTLMKENATQVASIDSQIVTVQKNMLRAVKDGGVDSHKYVQQLIELNARKEGLLFISNRIDFFRKKRDEASNRI